MAANVAANVAGVGVFHPGTQHSWTTARALAQLGRLGWYATGIFHRPDRWPYALASLLPSRAGAALEREFARFACPDLDPGHVRTLGWHEWAERLAARAGARRLAARLDAAGNRAFGPHVAALLRAEPVELLWGYNGSSEAVFTHPAAREVPRVLDRTIGDWRAWNALLPALRDRYGAWFPAGEGPVPPARLAADDREYAAADLVVCGSERVAQSVAEHAGVDRERLAVLPYSFDPGLFDPGAFDPEPVRLRGPASGPVRFLFVGHLHPRKGIQHVLEAVTRLSPAAASLTVVGHRLAPEAAQAPYADRFAYRSTVPRAEMAALMRAHDVLVLPSWFEGSAITLLEALACGCAVIQTEAAGIGADARSGIVLERPDTELVRMAMERLVDEPDTLSAMRAAAPARAAHYGFAAYTAGVAGVLARLGH